MTDEPARAPSRPRAARSRPAGLLVDVGSAVVIAAVGVTIAVSVGTLVFGAAGPEHVARGIGLALASFTVVAAAVALLGSQRGAVASVQDTPAAVLAGAAAAVVTGGAGAAGPDAAFATVAALCGLTTVVTGLVFVVVGWLRLGALVRFLPYPVMGGFLAGTGWLLLAGGVSVMTGRYLDLSDLGAALGPNWPATVLPGLALSAGLLVLNRRVGSPLAYPAAVIAAVGVFYLVMLVSGADLESWRAAGLLLAGGEGGDMVLPFGPAHLAVVDWGLVASQLPALAAVPVLALIGTLLNVTAAELQAGDRVDLDRQLRAAGFGNIVAGACGGMVGYHAVSLSELNRRAGRGTRATALIAAGLVLAALLLGGSAVGYLPRSVIGGVVSFLGLGFLFDWLVVERRRLAPFEYAIVVTILLVIALVGFLEGMAVGLVLTVLLFVVSYSRVDPVRYAATGAELRSRVRRSEAEDAALAAAADGLLVMQLQGFLFFGTTARVLERAEAAWRERPGLTVLLDLSRVTGIDASGLTALRTLGRRADANGSRLWLAAVPPAAAAALGRLGEAGGAREPSRFASVDAALEAWESEVLATAVPAAPGPTPTGDAREPSMAGLGAGAAGEQATGLAADAVAEAARLAAALAGSGVPPESLAPYVERVALAGGEELFAQGDPSDALYLVASGRVTSLRLRPGAEPERLETMRAGHAVGEVGILTGAGRGASVRADERTVLYRLSHDALQRMARDDPRTAAALYQWLAQRMAGRIGHLVGTVDALRP